MPKKPIPQSRRIPLPVMRMKYKDIFDIKEFYLALREWCVDHGWKDEEDEIDHVESYYGEITRAGGAKEIFFWWRLFKPAEGTAKAEGKGRKVNYYLDLDFHAIGIIDTEVIKDGAKIKVQKGEINLEISSFIDKAYEAEFSSGILKEFKNFFSTKVYKRQLDRRQKELYQEIYTFNNFIKQWFKLRRYLPHEEAGEFFKSYAWPSHVKE
ncbi:hypothetical protein J4479_05295 [Candidatus Woesearchaeota archaeon]|nr:hypothetical protein [Candidatus Woesearchaeota archaeon]